MMRLISLFLLLFISFYSNGQPDKASWSVGANPYYGGVLRYKPTMKKLEFTNLHGIEIYANKIASGEKAWHKLYNYPQWGLAAAYFNYGVPKELGYVYSLTTYLDFTPSKKRNKWRYNIGTGIVYSSARFDTLSNPENTAISSKISYVLRGTIHREFKLNENYYFNINLAFRHYSNGRLNMPNNGMNYPIVGMGIRYVFNPKPIVAIDNENVERPINKKIHFALRGSMSWREVWQEDVKHKAYSVSIYGSRQVSKYNNLLVGLDAFKYDQASVDRQYVVYRDQNNIILDHVPDDDTRQLAFTVGTQLLISKVSVIVQGGFYIYRPQEYYATWYQRYGVAYNFTNNIFAQVSLKAHSRTADMVEFGVGLSI
ncbi:MAG TPA: acyloxyacyl hydrolase [Fulvivirga sp.]|nr:acyloxyacyl hydrolase [Fulvivirga sp.]